MRPKFKKQSVLKLIGRIILHKHGYNTPPLGAELGSRACPGVHTRDCGKSREDIWQTEASKTISDTIFRNNFRHQL